MLDFLVLTGQYFTIWNLKRSVSKMTLTYLKLVFSYMKRQKSTINIRDASIYKPDFIGFHYHLHYRSVYRPGGCKKKQNKRIQNYARLQNHTTHDYMDILYIFFPFAFWVFSKSGNKRITFYC